MALQITFWRRYRAASRPFDIGEINVDEEQLPAFPNVYFESPGTA